MDVIAQRRGKVVVTSIGLYQRGSVRQSLFVLPKHSNREISNGEISRYIVEWLSGLGNVGLPVTVRNQVG